MFLDAELIEAFEPASVGGSKPSKVKAGAEAIYSIPESRRLSLDTLKNITIHFFVERALISSAMLASNDGPADLQRVKASVQELSKLFKFEFRFRADATFEEIYQQTLTSMQELSEVVVGEDAISPGSGHDGWSGSEWLETYAAMLRSFLEGYRIVARSLEALLAGPMNEKDFTKKALATGNVMYLAGEVSRREAVSKSLVSNALSTFADQRVVSRSDKKLSLTETYLQRDVLVELENTIVHYLEREAHA